MLSFLTDIPALEALFNEEVGLVLEVREADVKCVVDAYTEADVPCNLIGYSLKASSDSVVGAF